MRDQLIGLILGLLLGALGTYVFLQNINPPQPNTPQLNQVKNPPTDAFKPDNKLPYPLNLPAASNVDVTYSINSTVTEVHPDSSTTSIKVKSIYGPNFPDPIVIPNSLTVTSTATSSANPNKTAKDIKVGDRIVVNLSYTPKSQKTYVSSVQDVSQ